MHDELDTRMLKLGSHPNLLCNLVRIITFVKNMYLLYVMNFLSNHYASHCVKNIEISCFWKF